MKKFNWGIIAPGKIAKKFAADLQLAESASLYAVSSRSLRNAEIFAESFPLEKCYDSYQKLIADPKVDVVYVAAPHAFHKRITIDCLNAGKSVLCEKPLGLSATEVKEMIDAAKANKVFLMEAIWTAFLPHYQYVKDLIYSEQTGAIHFMKSDFGFKAPFNSENRLFAKKLGGGSLLDIGIYPLFCALDLLGIPETVKASATFAQTGVDTQTHAILGYQDKMVVASSSFVDTTPTETWIYCDDTTIRMCGRWHEPTSVEIIANGSVKTESFQVRGNGYQYEAIEVMNCLRKGNLQSDVLPWQKSLDLAKLIDRVKNDISLSYT
ncbi:MAG: Gfo/Idh/MocA family oxidoreductase [Cyclobacteriaceae bacterium]